MKKIGPLEFFRQTAREYGGIVRFRFLVFRAYLVTEPAYIQHVLRGNHLNYDKNLLDYQLVKRVLGNGLLTSDGDFWKRQRRLAQPAFARTRIEQYGPLMVRAAEDLARDWREIADGSGELALDREMARITFRIIGEAIMSTNLRAESEIFRAAFDKANALLIRRMESVVPAFLPMPMDGLLRRAAGVLQDMAMRLIRQRRAELERQGAVDAEAGSLDLMTRLMLARDPESGEVMSDLQLRDELLTLLTAGHETTANALTWTFYLLARNPGAREKLEAELDGLPGDRPLDVSDLERLSYTRMVFEESMRLYPPVWSIVRRAAGDDVIDGYPIPKGSIMLLPMWVVHRSERFWERPDEFRPERFSAEESAGRPAFAYYPFSGGPRMCMGRDFGMMEGVLLLANLAREFRLEQAEDRVVEPEARVTLGPQGGMPMRIRRR